MGIDFIPKSKYDRAVELLYIIVRNMVYMDYAEKVARYLSDCGFTDDELRELVNLKPVPPDDTDS